MPLTLQQIGAIHPSRDGPDQHLAGARAGDRRDRNAKNLRSARRRDVDDAHGRGEGDQGAFTSFAGERLRSAKGLKSVRVSKASTPSRRLSHATPA